MSTGGLKGRRVKRQHGELAWLARGIVEVHYTDPEHCSTRTIAEELGVTTSHLCHAYSQVFGSTLGEYLRELRVKQAQELLRNPHLSIKEIAARVGFAKATYRAFYNTFRAETGLSPSDFRRDLRQKGMMLSWR